MRKGIATPITLVVLMVVFTSLLAATSYMALGTLRGGAVERGSYQAFLIAESALDAFPKLARCGQNPPSSYSLPIPGGTTLTATYAYAGRASSTPISSGDITVQVTAEVGGAKARVQQDFSFGCGIAGAIPAALTSRPHVEVNGDAQVIGQEFSGATGLLPVTKASLTASLSVLQNLIGGKLTLNVQDATLIPVGSYVQIPTGGTPKTYRVDSKDGNTLTLTTLFTPSLSDVILPGAQVSLVQFGVKSYDSGTKTLTLNDARGLVPGQTVRVNGAEAVIKTVDLATQTVTLEWKAGATPPSSILEGTPLIPQILGAASNLTIDDGNDKKQRILYGKAENSPMVPSDPDELFLRVFGMTKDTFLTLYPPVSSSNFNGTLQNWELKVVQGDLTLAGKDGICGSGILVVFGNLTINTTGNDTRKTTNSSCEFQGLIYVAGDYDQYGNAVLKGAVVVEGVAEVLNNCSGNNCRTEIRGGTGGQEAGKIEYDPLVLHRLRVASQAGGGAVAKAGTWRRL
ncbi:MAG: hypothetical protein ACP5JV_04025 [Thermus sp.]|uniref:hypothetical protein n=1 Tax=Thermus sp. TaxID=275 RepID=UPI003D0DD65D